MCLCTDAVAVAAAVAAVAFAVAVAFAFAVHVDIAALAVGQAKVGLIMIWDYFIMTKPSRYMRVDKNHETMLD